MVIGDKLNLKCVKTAVKLGGGTAWFGACSLLKELASLCSAKWDSEDKSVLQPC